MSQTLKMHISSKRSTYQVPVLQKYGWNDHSCLFIEGLQRPNKRKANKNAKKATHVLDSWRFDNLKKNTVENVKTDESFKFTWNIRL